MLKAIFLTGLLFVGGLMLVNHALESHAILFYLDKHPNPSITPKIAYGLGQGYALFNNLPEATTYFMRVYTQYPKSSLAEGAYFYYVNSLDIGNLAPKTELLEMYTVYLEHYPEGEYRNVVEHRSDSIRLSR